MPSVIAMMERREARAREVLDRAEERLRAAEEQAVEARQRWEFARIGREELMDELAAAGAQVSQTPADTGVVDGGPQTTDSETEAPSRRVREGYDERPSQWHEGLDRQALCGMYRQHFETVVAADGLVDVATIADALGQGREKLAVERVRHRAYALHAKGWLKREKGLFRPAAGPAGGPAGDRAGAGALRRSGG
ncbi:hypothetical protein [Streptomyces sp. NPDC091215]|uniref:hypothetical protein n=1 Tax=Streptomyces sp. NPDC091215 TaxID=3155192 RepID=UPI00342D6B15